MTLTWDYELERVTGIEPALSAWEAERLRLFACSDLSQDSTNPIEDGAYQFMHALNGWSFGVDPTSGGLFTGCR